MANHKQAAKRNRQRIKRRRRNLGHLSKMRTLVKRVRYALAAKDGAAAKAALPDLAPDDGRRRRGLSGRRHRGAS
jgi:small subunit ribosomal protein S20